jgi:protein O-mannosyl-transferase
MRSLTAHNPTPRPCGAFFLTGGVLLLIPLLCLIVYAPGLSGSFVFDDYPNILHNDTITTSSLSGAGLLEAALSGEAGAGPLQRPISMLTFAVNYALGGQSPRGYKITNLVIHILNTLLVFWVIFLLVPFVCSQQEHSLEPRTRILIAGATALLWGLHPIQLTSVLYVVQRMTSLAALFTLLGIVAYLIGRIKLIRENRGFGVIVVGTLLFGLLATLSKENGLLLFAYLFVLELTLFRLQTASRRSTGLLSGYFAVVVVMPALLLLAFVVFHPDWLFGGYRLRPFTLPERLFTESRVIWFYLTMLFAPNNAALGLFHDDFLISSGLFSPISTLFAVSGLTILLLAAFAALKPHRIFALAVLWFLTGHVMESTALPLELIHEHRNYLPSLGPLFFLAYLLLKPYPSHSIALALRAGAAVCVIFFASMTTLRAIDWSGSLHHARVEAWHHPGSARAHYELGRLLIQLHDVKPNISYLDEAKTHMKQAAALDRATELPLFALIHLAYLLDQTPEPELLNTLSAQLAEKPVQPTTISAFHNLIQCASNRVCRLPPNNMLQLFGATLNNPALNGNLKAKMLLQLVAYYLNVLGEREASVEIIKEVVTMFPHDYAYRLAQIKVYLALGRIEQALSAVRKTRQALGKNIMNRYRANQTRRLAALEDQALSALGKNRGNGTIH